VNRGAPPGYTLSTSLLRVIIPKSWISHSAVLCSRTSLGWNNECADLASGPASTPEVVFLHVSWARSEPVDLVVLRETLDTVTKPRVIVDLGRLKPDPEGGHFVMVKSAARNSASATRSNTQLVG
jgi:hypothetical protein